MLGVVNKAIEAFVCQRYGDKLWADLLMICRCLGMSLRRC